MRKTRNLGVLGIALLALFALLTANVQAGRTTQFDQRWTDACRQHAAENAWCLHSLRWLTHLGDGPFLLSVGLAALLVLLWRRRFALAALWVVVALGGNQFNISLKGAFDRPRPPMSERDEFATATNPSYPSGHTMAAVINFGLLGYVYVRWGRGRRLQVAVLLSAVVLLVGVSRIYLRAHWVTDVLGGFLAGGAWLALWVAAAEALRHRRLRIRLAEVAQGDCFSESR